jgi:hypothetical protein
MDFPRQGEVRQVLARVTGIARDRMFHLKFGNVAAIDVDKLTIQFDKAGEKRVADSFVERV